MGSIDRHGIFPTRNKHGPDRSIIWDIFETRRKVPTRPQSKQSAQIREQQWQQIAKRPDIARNQIQLVPSAQ